MATITLDGVTFSPADWENRGHLTSITVGGSTYPRWQGMWVAGVNELQTQITGVGGSLVATSTTSATIGAGAQSLTVQAAKGFTVGNPIVAYEAATPSNYMIGIVDSYDVDTGDIDFTVASGDTGGSGTITAWTVSISGFRGPEGGIAGGTLTGNLDAGGTYRLINLPAPSAAGDAVPNSNHGENIRAALGLI